MKPKTAIAIMLWLIGTTLIFHLSILTRIVPYDITWGGRLQNDMQMYVFESVSIMVNLFLMLILLIKGGYIRELFPIKFINFILWVFLLLFAVNTIGNIFAETDFEKYFAFLTLLSSWLIWVVLRKKEVGDSTAGDR